MEAHAPFPLLERRVGGKNGGATLLTSEALKLMACFCRLSDQVNTAGSVEFITSLQGFTGPGGHPLEVINDFRPLFPESWSNEQVVDEMVFIVEKKLSIRATINFNR